jgi:transcriptional regulator GlxA family with amidase domain
MWTKVSNFSNIKGRISFYFKIKGAVLPKQIMPEVQIHKIGFILIDGFSLMSLSSAVEPLRAANHLSGETLFDLTFIHENGTCAHSSIGLISEGKLLPESGYDFDLVFVISAGNPFTHENPDLIKYIKMLASNRVQLGGISGGSVFLARAGVMTNRSFTVHWDHFEALQELSTLFHLTPSLYVIDQDRYTCAGGIAPMDMMSAIITSQHGRELAKAVNDWFIYTRVRDASDPQRIGLVEKYNVHHPAVICAIELMQNHISDPLTCEQLAKLSDIGERQLSRLFQKYLGRKVNSFYSELRLSHAHTLVQQTSMTIIEIAISAGYDSVAYFSQRFKRVYGYTPSELRKTDFAHT